MNKIKWQVLYRKLSYYPKDEFIYYINYSDFPALNKLKHLSTKEIMIFTILILQLLGSKEKINCIDFKNISEYFIENKMKAEEINFALCRLLDLNLISIYIHHDSFKNIQTLAYNVNEEEIINKEIYLPEKEINIWTIPNLNKG